MCATPEAVMLFAAGFGTRMLPLTRDRPKPLIAVAGRPLIDRAVDLARGVDAKRIVANLHYKARMLEAHLAPQGIATIVEEPDILETGGGLRNALPLLGRGPVWTLNPDALWLGPNPLALLRDAWNPTIMDALLLCIPTERCDGPGDFDLDADGRLSRGRDLVFGGAQIIRTEGLADIPDPAFSLNVLWDIVQRKGRLHGLVFPGRWCDVGRLENIALAETMLAGPDV